MTVIERLLRFGLRLTGALSLCIALGGCLIEKTPSLGGEYSRTAAFAQVEQRFPRGTKVSDVEAEMLGAGYHCQHTDVGTPQAPRPALACSSGHPVKAATLVIGYHWAYDFFYDTSETVTGIEIIDGYSHYS